MSAPSASTKYAAIWRQLPRGVWILGFVSLLMDASSEMIHALLPVFLVAELGASAFTVGVIEGIAEATAAVTRLFSGILSDWLGRRKSLAALGYGLAACAKPIFPLATSAGWVGMARFIDRVGKGIRGAPRDALIADISPVRFRGASFGLRQSLDTVGAVIGPLIAIALMAWSGDDFVFVFWIAVVPGFLAFGLIATAVHEPERSDRARPERAPLRRRELGRLGAVYWQVVAVAAIFTLARFSEAFLILRAQSLGLSLTLVPVVLVVMNVAYALSAYPAGALSDRHGRLAVLFVGLGLLVLADGVLAFAREFAALSVGATLWGVHMGFSQGVFAALVADTAPTDLRGTSYGVFNLATGLTLLAASLIAGILWDRIGPAATFLGGASFTLVSLVGLWWIRPRLAGREAPQSER